MFLILPIFKRLGQKSKNNFVRVLVQMWTRNFLEKLIVTLGEINQKFLKIVKMYFIQNVLIFTYLSSNILIENKNVNKSKSSWWQVASRDEESKWQIIGTLIRLFLVNLYLRCQPVQNDYISITVAELERDWGRFSIPLFESSEKRTKRKYITVRPPEFENLTTTLF